MSFSSSQGLPAFYTPLSTNQLNIPNISANSSGILVSNSSSNVQIEPTGITTSNTNNNISGGMLYLNNGAGIDLAPTSTSNLSIQQYNYGIYCNNGAGISLNNSGPIVFYGTNSTSQIVANNTGLTMTNANLTMNGGEIIMENGATFNSINTNSMVVGTLTAPQDTNTFILLRENNIYLDADTSTGGAVYVNSAIINFSEVQTLQTTASNATVSNASLQTNTTPTKPTQSNHLGYYIYQPLIIVAVAPGQNYMTLSNGITSSNLFNVLLSKGTWLINGLMNYTIPASTIFSSINNNLLLGTTNIQTINLTSPTDTPSIDINYSLPIMATTYNSTDNTNFSITTLLNYTSASTINLLPSSYIYLTRIA